MPFEPRQELWTTPQRLHRPILPSSMAFGFFYRLAPFHFRLQVGDHIVHCVERTVERTFFSFVKPGVYDTPLRGSVFFMGRWQFWNDGDYATGGLELHLVAWLETSTASDAVRYPEGCSILDGNGHLFAFSLRVLLPLVKQAPHDLAANPANMVC
jgi:hypothetical protein